MAAPAPARIPVTEPPQPTKQPPARLLPPEPRPIVRSSRWLRVLLVAIALFLALDYGVSAFLRTGWLNARFTRRLEAAFGRPVEVSNYSFSLLEGPRLEANYITVGEDPRFGKEYFLRADQLAVGLRWSALLRGRVELGALSFTNPHLNLVHLPDGEWNLESWLPRPPGRLGAISAVNRGTARPERIEIAGGRIDFKSGGDKLPFALTDVEGGVEQVAPGSGSWRMDLRAQPFRAAVAVQQAGELRLTGIVGGTSSRLRPANLRLDWSDASLSDVLRLARGTDYGVRGLLAFQLAARTEGSGWRYTSRAELSQLHGWNSPPRADDPSANFIVDARWVPGKGRLELTRATIDTPDSKISATGGAEWSFDPRSSRIIPEGTQLELISPGVQLGDLLTWFRAFHPGVEDGVALSGRAGVDLTISGWPPRIENGAIATEGATLSGGGILDGLHLSHAVVEFSPRRITIPPATIATSNGAQFLHVQASVDRRAKSQSDWALDGKSKKVQALIASASALGYRLPEGWSLDGPAQFHLAWKGASWPAVRRTAGSIRLAGLKIHAPFLNREITQVKATVNLSPVETKIQLASADAFAANWSGTLERQRDNGSWNFALAANELNAADMDRWLNPQRRESLLDRVFPFLAPSPRPASVPTWLKGNGTISLGEFMLAPFNLRQVYAQARVEGRRLEISQSHANFYGGTIRGSGSIELTSQPSYVINSTFRNVNLNQMTARTLTLAGLFGGVASGKLQVSAKGLGRDALLRSLHCRGEAQVRNGDYPELRLDELPESGRRALGIPAFRQASAEFVCENGQVRFSRLMLKTQNETFSGRGDVDFQRRLNLDLQSAALKPASNLTKTKTDPRPIFHLTGTIRTPVLTHLSARSAPK